MTLASTPPVGSQLRTWRTRRRLSQLALALQADISTRHLSYLETGRSQPSREMILRLARRLDVPPRERNDLLTAAGFAPMYRAKPLSDPALAAARRVVELVLRAHEPFPALAVDRHWNVVAQNRAVAPLLEGIAPALLDAPVNALRLSLHPGGLAPRIVNFAAWRRHVLARLEAQIAASADAGLRALEAELAAYPVPALRADGPSTAVAYATASGNGDVGGHDGDSRGEGEGGGDGDGRGHDRDADGGLDAADEHPHTAVALPLVLDTSLDRLSLLSTTTVFGTPVDITLSELALETFFPADEATAAALRRASERAAADADAAAER